MARLLMISTDRLIFEPGSAVRARQVEYAKNWESVDIIVFGLRSDVNVKDEEELAPNCRAYSTGSRTKFMYPFDARKVGQELIERSQSEGRAITEVTCQDASLTAWAGVALKRKFGLPLEIQIHEDIGSPHYGFTATNRVRRMLAQRNIPQADKIRVVSERIKSFLVRRLRIPAAKIEVRPISVDTDRIKNAPILPGADLHKKYPQFEKIVLMSSRIEAEKNIELAIEAFREVVDKLPKAGLVIVGNGTLVNRLKSLARVLGIEKSIVFEPRVDQGTLASYYKSCDLFLNTSLFEGYGMSLVEAQAAGCRVVSTDVGVAAETGAKIVGWNAADVAAAVVEVLGAANL